MAFVVICLAKGQKFNFSKYIFDSLVRNVDSSSKFYMYPRFIQLIIQNQVGDLSTHTTRFISPALTKKVFANMRRVGKGFSGVETPLFEGMLVVRQPAEEELVNEQVQVDDVVAAAIEENVAEDVAHDAVPSPPSHDIPSPSQEPSSPPQQPYSSPQAPPHDVEFPTQFQQVLNVCSNLTKRVENLENDNAAQKLVIIKLKARVKKLEKANLVKSSKLRRLRKVGASKQVESSDAMEDVFNQGRMIDDIDKDKGIELVKDADIAESEGRHDATKQVEKQAEIYHIDLDHSSKVLSMQEDDSEVQEVVEVVTTAKLITEVVTAAASQVSAASVTIPTAKPCIHAAAPTVVAAYTRRRKGDAAMDHVNQKSNNPRYIKRYQGMKKRPQTESEVRKNMMIYLKNTAGYKMDFFKGMTYAQICPIFQARFDENMRFLFKSREEMEEEDQEIIKSINETPTQKAAKRRKLSEEAQEAEDLRKLLEEVDDEDDDVFIEATPLASKVPVVDYQIVLIDNKPRFKIIRADETHQFYISFTTLLKNFDREDLENLWGIVKDIFSTLKPTNFSDEYLLLTLKTMFEKPDEQDAIWRNQKSVHEEESEMSLELLRLKLKLFKNIAAAEDITKFSSAKANDQTECHKCGKKDHFARDCWSKTSAASYQSPFQPKLVISFQHKPELRPTKDFEAKYNKVKVKLALLSSSTSASKPLIVKNKGLIAEAYEWDKEDVSSDDNEMVEVKVLMALAEDNDAVSKEGAKNDHDTVRILPAESQINITDPLVVVTRDGNKLGNFGDHIYHPHPCFSASSPSPSLSPSRIDLHSHLRTQLCGSYDHDTNGHNVTISLEREIKPRNLQHVIKRCETCGSTVHNTTDHYDVEWFRRGKALHAKNVEAQKSKKTGSSKANRSKTPTKWGKIDNTLFVYKTQTDVILVQIYVDDIIFESTSTKLCKQFAKLMTQRYKISMIVKTPMVPPNNLGPDLNGKAVNETRYRDIKQIPRNLTLLLLRELSAEAEYVAAARCCANIRWMTSQLTDYDIIYEKHIDIRYYFLKDHILKGDIELHFIPTQYQLVDIFTKPLDELTFRRLIVELDPRLSFHITFAMSTQQDIYVAGSESRPPMLNKENYVPWSSRLLRYAKSRPNGKLIHNSIINGPYVRRMIPEPGDTNREVPENETFHVQTDDELTEKELKQIEADDQAIQTILLGEEGQTKDLHKADYTQLYDFLKYNQKEVDELKAKRLSKTQDPLALMATSNNPYNFLVLNQDQPSFNQNYMKQPMPNPKGITDPTTAMNMALALMAKSFKLNYSTPTNNNQRISSNPRNRQIAQPGNLNGYNAIQNVENQVAQNPRVQNVKNQNGLIGVPGNANQNGNGNLVAARAEENAAEHNGNQIRSYNCR
nr:hypothetical protein [Tanacetum cinerariifolium]